MNVNSASFFFIILRAREIGRQQGIRLQNFEY
jgi:hypothetical protein